MRRFLLMLFGLAALVAAAALLWMSYRPQSKQERTTGGVLYTQQEVAQEIVNSGGASPDLGAVTDVQVGTGPAIMQMQSEIGQAAVSDLSTAEGSEISSAPQTVAEAGFAAAPAVPLTTDIMIDENTQVQVASIATTAGTDTTGQGGTTGTAGGYEQRVVNLEWPKNFQVGRGGLVRIKLKVLEGGALQPVAEVAGDEVLATPILITDRYATHDAYVTATISAPDFKVKSVSPAEQLMPQGSEPEWRWTLTASNSSNSIISLGLMISWQPKPGSGQAALTNIPIWGQTVQTEVNYVFGLITVPQASTAGTVLAVVGFVSQIPMADKIIELFWKVLFGRRRRRSKQDSRSRR
jgi:hypothetical protein